MPEMSITVPHHLSEDEALRRIQGLLADLKREYGDQISDLQETWTGTDGRFSFKAMGFNLAGTLSVQPSEVRLTGDLPFAALPFKGRIEQLIGERAERLLA